MLCSRSQQGVSLAERCDALVRQIERSAEFRNEKVALLEARRHYCWYLKGVKYANYYKDQINHMETLEDLYRVTAGIINPKLCPCARTFLQILKQVQNCICELGFC